MTTTPATTKTPTPAAAPAPKAAPVGTPTPTQHENDQFRLAVAAGTLPANYAFAPDGSPVEPPGATQPPPTWP